MSEKTNSKTSTKHSSTSGAARGDKRRPAYSKSVQNSRRAGEAPPTNVDEVLGVRELLLRADKTSNFMDWKEEMEKYAYRHYRQLGDIIKFDKHHEFEAPRPDLSAIRDLRTMREEWKAEVEEIKKIFQEIEERIQNMEIREKEYMEAAAAATTKSQKEAVRAERESIEMDKMSLEADKVHLDETKEEHELKSLEIDATESFNRENDRMRLKIHYDGSASI
jgi:hypothetical protein